MICVGVDAGGTATVAAVSRNGEVSAETVGGSANANVLGVAGAADAIVATIQAALHGDVPDAIYVGAAGAGRTTIANGLLAAVQQAFRGTHVTVSSDAAIALRGKIPSGDGVVLIAGTGSVAYAERDGVGSLVGGFGYLIGDEGSAFAIGMDAVRLYGRVLDRRAQPDDTTAMVAAELAAPDRETLLAALYDAPFRPARIAALAPHVLALANSGNRASTKILQTAGLALGELVKSTIRIAGLTDASPRVALAGGLFAENSMLSFLLETRIVGDTPGAAIVKSGESPVYGALRLAERLPA
jgi:N-acetylglucosamine kinase-like BadF-type ATPase